MHEKKYGAILQGGASDSGEPGRPRLAFTDSRYNET
jgi:hypothetical protein